MFAQEPAAPLIVKVTVDNKIPISKNQVQVTMEVTALAAVQNAKASFGSSQNISIKKQSEIELGSLNVNQKRTFITQIAFPKDGHAVLKGIFTAIDKNGNKLGASDEIYFLVKKEKHFMEEETL